MAWVFNDGGRAAAGFRGAAGDCVTRALAIATGESYADIYKEVSQRAGKTARNGVSREISRECLMARGWKWVPTMTIGSGCRVHLRADELPAGVVICKCSGHLVTVIDGVIHDTHDSSRDGKRCVYGYWVRGDVSQ
jgi:hypothetical protein